MVSELSDIDYVETLIKIVKPDIIVNFAGETDVINPWGNVPKTFDQNFTIPKNILSSIVKINPNIFYFQSSSSMMFAKSNDYIINENSHPKPMFPYGISKLSSHYLVQEYRLKYNLKCSSGIFFNHESFYRSGKFISKNEFLDQKNINFNLNINNYLVQKGNTKDLLFSFDTIIAHVSNFFTLKTGDLIFTGTPEGVGPIKIGDRLEAYIENQKLLDFEIK